MFHLVDDENNPVAAYSFHTGDAAIAKAIELNTLVGKEKFQPRPTPELYDLRWETREMGRINRGEYLVFEYMRNMQAKTKHYLHKSKDNDGTLAYTKDPDKGARDIQTKISFKGYLETYRKSWLETRTYYQLEDSHKFHCLGDDGVLFATSPDEIESVYTIYDPEMPGVGGSCMRSNGWDIHPTRVYGAGDLAIAYRVDSQDRTIERVVCWPEKKLYGRIYSNTGLIKKALVNRGFTYTKCFTGARLLKIIDPYIVMPFLDDDNIVTECDGESHFRIGVLPNSTSLYDHRSQKGRTRKIGDIAKCKLCSSILLPSESQLVNDGEISLCASCCGGNTWISSFNTGLYMKDIESVEIDIGRITKKQFSFHCDVCEITGIKSVKKNFTEVRTPMGGKRVHISQEGRYFWRSNRTGIAYSMEIPKIKVENHGHITEEECIDFVEKCEITGLYYLKTALWDVCGKGIGLDQLENYLMNNFNVV